MKMIFKKVLAFILTICIVLGSFAITSFAAYMGDADSNGTVNSLDALVVLQYSTGLKTLTAAQIALCDMTDDGKVNSTDALHILQTSTGLIPLVEKKEESLFPYAGRVTADPSLRLRSGASTSYTTLAHIPYGTELTITKESNGWGQTTYNGKSGWVSLDYVERIKPVSGTFTIVAYGWGHGVGMSQYGAKKYAESGWTYDKILLHYYYSDKTKIINDSDMPTTVKYGGKEIELKKYIAGSVKAEVGDSWHIEAIKAQLVAIYTYAKYYDFDVSSSTHAYDSSYNYKGTKIETAINQVLGKYIDYNGEAILSTYCASMGGKNTSAKSAWQGSDRPYLRGGRTSPEDESLMKKTYTFTTDEIKTLAKNNLGVTLTGSPDTWFTNIVHDKSISDSIGYIDSLTIGGKVVRGERIRTKLFGYGVRSHCLSIKYNY